MDDLAHIAKQFLAHHAAEKRAGVKLQGAPVLPKHILAAVDQANTEHRAKLKTYLDAHEVARAKGLV